MEKIEKLIIEYENNIENTLKHKSYINEVKEYKGYIFKKIRNLKKFENEVEWLKKLKTLNYNVPQIAGTYNNEILVTKKIDGNVISDDNAKEYLYNIGKLLAELHNLPIVESCDWKDFIMSEYIELKESVKDVMEKDLFDQVTEFIENGLQKTLVSKLAIIHRDLRPENVILSDGKYYLLDLESMCVGDIDYDFTRMFNLLNEKNIYQYEDFKNLIDGYRQINNIKISEEKWQLYNKFYSFRIYARMLLGRIKRDAQYEEYLKKTILSTENRVTEWIKKYNKESKDYKEVKK